jgi:hypothetical protein
MSERVFVPKDETRVEPDHTVHESESLRNFLRPINPDTLKWLAEWHRRDNWRRHVRESLDQNAAGVVNGKSSQAKEG